MKRWIAGGPAWLRPTPHRAGGLPPSYTTAVLGKGLKNRPPVRHLLPAGARSVDVSLPDGACVLLTRKWRDRWLGYRTPHDWKTNGEPPPGVAPERVTADVDGVWDFRRECGPLLSRSPGHHALIDRDFADKTLAAAMRGGARAPTWRAARWLEEQGQGSRHRRPRARRSPWACADHGTAGAGPGRPPDRANGLWSRVSASVWCTVRAAFHQDSLSGEGAPRMASIFSLEESQTLTGGGR